jgi:hypothetical protein
VQGVCRLSLCEPQAPSSSVQHAPDLEDLLGMVLQHVQPLRQVAQVMQGNLHAQQDGLLQAGTAIGEPGVCGRR